MSKESMVFRVMSARNDKKRDKGLTIPDDVVYITGERYSSNRKFGTLDIVWPKRYKGEVVKMHPIDGKSHKRGDSVWTKVPVIISVHGGGYVYGSKEVYQFYCASLAEKGFVVINFDYRLAPKYKFPAPLEDLQNVILWMMKHKNDYPFDLDNVFLVGDSAGAQLASQYAAMFTNPEYRKLMGFRKPKIGLRGVGLCCGMYDMKSKVFDENQQIKGLMKDYLGTDDLKKPVVDEREDNVDGTTSIFAKVGGTLKDISSGIMDAGSVSEMNDLEGLGDLVEEVTLEQKLDVMSNITSKFPPTYLFSSGGDFLRDECQPMAEFLKEKGVPCEYKIYGDENTYHVFHCNVRDELAQQANEDQWEYLKQFIVS